MMSKNILLHILRDTKGATAIEYGLLAGLIAMSAMVGMTAFTDEVNSLWNSVGSKISNQINKS